MKQVGSILGTLLCAFSASAARVAIVTVGDPGAPARHGLDNLRQALSARGNTIGESEADADLMVVAGLAPDRRIRAALRAESVPVDSQAFAIRRTAWNGRRAVVLAGADSVGLMYAAGEAAGQVRRAASTDPFAGMDETSGRPYLQERGISIYTMHRAYFESRLHDTEYWRRYFSMLARSRINTFTIIFGYENGGYMAPPYPYFFDVPEHPEVRLAGGSAESQRRYTESMRQLIRIAHEYGIDVILAIWDHIYRGGVQGGGIPGASEHAGKEVTGLVSGLEAENLAAYTKAALRRFLATLPDIDGLEFRMHSESGLKKEEMPAFWHEVFGLVARARPGLRITLRAKELPDSIIDDALAQGLRARVETKYWMEQMGMPFHPSHVNRQNQHDRRHGYADLLSHPQRYRVHWRLWSGGTTRLLLWADPEYVRRYAESARLYDGYSIDVNEMLATRMLGEPHGKAPLPILNARYRYYDYEFERYWHFYQVWGHVAYNPATPGEVWEREFRARFGASGPALMRGLHLASRVLPRIVAASYRYQLFPTTRGWAEMMRQGDLPQFAEAEGSDIEQFQNPRDAATAALAGTSTSMRRPADTSQWFTRTADAILAEVRAAGRAGASGNEAISTLADLRILAGLARFHAARLNAAVDYNIHLQKRDPAVLDRAIGSEKAAVNAWSEIVEAAGSIYSAELPFGVHRVGFPRHWREELSRLRAGLVQLEQQRASLGVGPGAARIPAIHPSGPPPRIRIERPAVARPGQDLKITVEAAEPAKVRTLRLRYRHLTQMEDYESVGMTRDAATHRFTASIPGGFITPQRDVMFFVEAIDTSGSGRNYPDLDMETPYVIVPVQRGEER